MDVAAFFAICVWFVPLFLFLSLSANDNALPSFGESGRGLGLCWFVQLKLILTRARFISTCDSKWRNGGNRPYHSKRRPSTFSPANKSTNIHFSRQIPTHTHRHPPPSSAKPTEKRRGYHRSPNASPRFPFTFSRQPSSKLLFPLG